MTIETNNFLLFRLNLTHLRHLFFHNKNILSIYRALELFAMYFFLVGE